jgi:O-antigen/teichoic acid export membrane protein
LLSQVLWAYVAAEFTLALVLLVLLVRDARAQQKAGNQERFRFEFDVAELAREGAATQASYILRIPFQGPFMRLLVGAFAGPLVTAAYGFFQAIADRIYHFMPTIMLKGVVETALVADYAEHKNPLRQSMVVALLLKVSLIILFLIASVTLGIGEPLVNLATGGKYGAQIWIALLIGLQVVAQVGGEALWIGLNAVGRVNAINRVWAGAATVSGLLMLIAFLTQHIALLIFSATLPYVVAFAWLRWVRAEPLLSAGLGERMALVLLVPLAMSVMSSRAVLWLLSESTTGVACAGAVACTVFVLATVAMHPITREEQAAVRQVSPRLASIITPLVVVR